jgi:hypothetical protein
MSNHPRIDEQQGQEGEERFKRMFAAMGLWPPWVYTFSPREEQQRRSRRATIFCSNLPRRSAGILRPAYALTFPG